MTDVPLDILAKERRRMVLRRLADVGDAESGLVAPEEFYEGSPSQEDRIALYHTDLPKLADAGAIRWDSNSGVVYPGTNFERFVGVLDAVSHRVKESQ